jgi:hypothetical protein
VRVAASCCRRRHRRRRLAGPAADLAACLKRTFA